MRIISLLLSFLLLVGCATVTPPEAPPTQLSWAARETLLNKLQSWEVNGKIAVHTAQESGSATIDWSQQQQNFRISLMGPFGSHNATLSGQPGAVTLVTSDGKHIVAKSPEQLLAQQMGWQLPVSNMNYWIRGLPAPGIPVSNQFDVYHRLTLLVQQGWNIQYLSYMNVNGIELPQKISISSATVNSKIIIYNWKLNQ